MIINHYSVFFLVLLLFFNNTSIGKTTIEFPIGYVSLSDDDGYISRRSYAGMELQVPRRPLGGVQLALKESRVLGRSLGAKFVMSPISETSSKNLISSIEKAIKAGTAFFILDLPLKTLMAVVDQYTDEPVLFYNARHQSDQLRRKFCSGNLFHTIPSDAMLNDALSQHLKKKQWDKILVLEGPEDRDEEIAISFKISANKFGLKIVDSRQFVLSNDPRIRDRHNISLLTAGQAHNVVFVADQSGEFSRYIPYQTQKPALVVGAQGLEPAAWHWSWERYGAPQLNQRFEKLNGKKMSDTEFAGWVAARSIITAVVKTRSFHFSSIYDHIAAADTKLDLYKGYPGSFRPWNRQLRQPVLLHTHNAVIASAPVDGFMHQFNDLDTLGLDRLESSCLLGQ
ncbi:MAG: ABC transporter substrate binding protein (PQQ-dependent alcohol dehydrogenase system) [Granulosicoccus sp.]|jgi:ABC transporter substrate binding protein (PQQ-dependent alcohol dehydrogenase system)